MDSLYSRDTACTVANGLEDKDEKVLTLKEYLKEQEALELEAAACFPGRFDECTYNKGYIRQPVYVCLTCSNANVRNNDDDDDGTFDIENGRSGICYSCSIACHSKCELVELSFKRHFRCDCGNSKFNSTSIKGNFKSNGTVKPYICVLQGEKDYDNEENYYLGHGGQNFDGTFCYCKSKDPEIICGDHAIKGKGMERNEKSLHKIELKQNQSENENENEAASAYPLSPIKFNINPTAKANLDLKSESTESFYNENGTFNGKLFPIDVGMGDGVDCLKEPVLQRLNDGDGALLNQIFSDKPNLLQTVINDESHVETKLSNCAKLHCTVDGIYEKQSVHTKSTEDLHCMVQCFICEDWIHIECMHQRIAMQPFVEDLDCILCRRCIVDHPFLESLRSIWNFKNIDVINDIDKSKQIVCLSAISSSQNIPIQKSSAEKAFENNSCDHSKPSNDLDFIENQSLVEEILLQSAWRNFMCRCDNCQLFWKKSDLQFFLKEEREFLPELDSDRSTSLYELGQKAIETKINRADLIVGLEAMGKFKRLFSTFIEPIAEEGRPVTADDINQFFAINVPKLMRRS